MHCLVIGIIWQIVSIDLVTVSLEFSIVSVSERPQEMAVPIGKFVGVYSEIKDLLLVDLFLE